MWELNSKVHDLISSRVLLPISKLQRMARPSRRPVMQSFYTGLRFRREAAGWSVEEKRDWVLHLLRSAARRAQRDTRFYQELFKRVGFDPWSEFSFEDFAQLPVLEREDIHQAGPALVSQAVPAGQLKKDSTGGSTGAPTEIWLGPEEKGWRDSATEYFMRRIGVPEGTRTALLWGHHLDPVKNDSLRQQIYSFSHNIRWFDCFRLSAEVFDRYHEEFMRWRPTCILAYAGALGRFAEHVRDNHYPVNYPTRCFVTGAEKLLPHHREVIESVFGRPVHERYGSRDVGAIGFQSDPRESPSYEIDWANIMVEPETTQSESAVLITKLHADGMPMLRYRIGDIGHFAPGSRPGQPTLSLNEIVGRDTDRVWLPEGSWIHGIQLPHLLKDYPVREFLFIQRADYSVELRIIPNSGFGQECYRSIFATVAANLPGIKLIVDLVDEIPRTRSNKFRPVISEVKPMSRRMAL